MALALPYRGLGVRSRLLLLFLLPTAAFLGFVFYVGYFSVRHFLETSLGETLNSTAAALSSQVNADRLLYMNAEDELGEGTRTYRNFKNDFDNAVKSTGAKRIFAIDTRSIVHLDTQKRVPLGQSLPEAVRDATELARVFKGETLASQVMFLGADGTWYKTGYAPLRWQGVVTGAIGVEASARFFEPFSRLWQRYAALAVLLILVQFLIALYLTRRMATPLERLADSALRIGQGDLTTEVKPDSLREIGILARTLDTMRENLRKRDEQLRMMLSGVAHEVRNPLGGIELFQGLLREEIEKPSVDKAIALKHVRRIQTETEYLARIVEEFLRFAKDQTIQKKKTNIKSWLTVCEQMLINDASARTVKLVCESEACELEVDESTLTSAVVNLVKNAIQAAPEGGFVHVKGEKRATHYIISITDNGAGIPANVLPRIFEPFFTTKEKGTGLGLALAKKFIELHNGTLECQSTPGKTTFTIALPL